MQARAQATFTSMKQFSTNENENDDYDMEVQKDEMESGFKAYLQKLKEIEDRKNKEDEDLMAKGLLSKQDLEKMKKSLFKDDSLYRSAFKEESIFMNPKSIVKTKEEKILKKSIPEKFEKIDQKTRQKSVIQAYPSNLSAIPNIDFWNERFQDKEFEINDLLKLVERSLQENEGTKKLLLTSLAYSKNGETEGSIVIELLMGGRKIKLEPVPQLIVNFVSHLGSISINYNNYLKKTNLDYDLPQQVYIKILNLHLSNINYNRKAFKRILAHLIRYNKSIPHETILACLEVFKKHKLGMTMLEFIHLILRNKIIINKESLKCFFDHLKDYKIISDDIDDLFKAFLKEYEWQYESSFLSGYLDVLIKQKKTDDFMKLFEKIKDFLMIRKIKTEEKQQEISNEEKPQILENIPVEINKEDSKKVQIIKKNEHIEAHNFYIDFVEKLNQHEVLKFSKLVFYDFINNKFTLTQKDFLVGLKTFNDSGEEFLVLYKQYKESPLFQFDEKLFTLLIEAINQSPTELSPVFDEILSEYIYTKKFALTTQNLNFFISAFGRTQRFFEFTSFLRFLARNKHELNRNTKLACYKVLGRVTDDMSKPYIKGLVDTIFE